MNTVNKIKTMAMALILLLTTQAAAAQAVNKVPRHFVGLYGGADLSNTSVFSGLTYEYLFAAGKKAELGIKGTYTFPYRIGNLLLFENGRNEVGFATLNILGTGYFFTNAHNRGEGFFLHAEAGISGAGWRFVATMGQFARPVGGLGLGWKWPMRNGKALRWTNTLQYTGANNWMPGNLSALSTLAIGL